MTSLRTLSALIAIGTLGNVCSAQTTYSVDVTGQMLYTINLASGVATPVGPVNANSGLIFVDLAWHQGHLYSVSKVTGFYIISEISTSGANAGSVIAGWTVWYMNYGFDKIGGIASDGTNLCMTYGTYPPQAKRIGKWGFDQNPITDMGPGGLPDSDGLGYFNGRFWSVDVVDSGTGYNIAQGAFMPLVPFGGDLYDNSGALNPADLVDYSASELVAMGQTGKYLIRISKSTGQRTTAGQITGAPSNAVFQGLATSTRDVYKKPILSNPKG